MKRALLFAAVCLAAYGADPQALVRKVLAYDYGRDPAAVRELETLALHAAGTAEAPAIEKLLLNGLASARTIPAKDAFCRNLAWVGSEAAIPALAGMLSDPATAEIGPLRDRADRRPESCRGLARGPSAQFASGTVGNRGLTRKIA